MNICGSREGGSCKSASIIAAMSPRAARSPAYMAASLPKLRESEMYFTRESFAASSRRYSSVPSFEPSSTKIISKFSAPAESIARRNSA